MKLPSPKDALTGAATTGTTKSGIIEAFRTVEVHIRANNNQGQAVINLSVGGPEQREFRVWLQYLIRNLDVVIVTSAGNNGVRHLPVDSQRY